ncbi:MAG: NAD(P)-dependent alcohol dehydrogenase [Chloroflexota bacterium]
MKAVLCTTYGSPDVLELSEVQKPTPKDKEILIKIHATTVTSGDCRIRSFNVPPMFWLPGRLMLGLTKPKQPILGTEFAGEVAAIGKDVTRFKVGDAVFGSSVYNFGTYAEYLCMSEDGFVAIKPRHATYTAAAAIPFGGFTALRFLTKGNTQPGKSVLINGASGAVGTYAVQLAKYFGAEVTAVCSGKNAHFVHSLGADHVIDYTKEDFVTRGQTYDIIFDVHGSTTFSQVKDLFNDYYLHAVMVNAAIKVAWYALTTGKKVAGGAARSLDTQRTEIEDLIMLQQLVELGEITPVIDRIYPLEQIVEAHRYVDTGHKKGVVVITIGENQ